MQVDVGGVLDLVLFDGHSRGFEGRPIDACLHFYHLLRQLQARGAVRMATGILDGPSTPRTSRAAFNGSTNATRASRGVEHGTGGQEAIADSDDDDDGGGGGGGGKQNEDDKGADDAADGVTTATEVGLDGAAWTVAVPSAARIVCAAFRCPALTASYGLVGAVGGFDHGALDAALATALGLPLETSTKRVEGDGGGGDDVGGAAVDGGGGGGVGVGVGGGQGEADEAYLTVPMADYPAKELHGTRRTVATIDFQRLRCTVGDGADAVEGEGDAAVKEAFLTLGSGHIMASSMASSLKGSGSIPTPAVLPRTLSDS
jgi:hypothetical protein